MSGMTPDVVTTTTDRRLTGWLAAWVKPYLRRVVLATVLVIAGSALQIVGPLLTAAAIDLYLKPEPGESAARVYRLMGTLGLPREGSTGLVTLVAAYLLSLLAGAVLLVWQARTMLMTGQLVMRDLRDALFAHLQRLELAWFHRTPAGRVMTRLTSDVEAVNELFTSGFVQILADLVLLGGIVTVLFSLDWRLALVAFSILPLLMLLSTWFRQNARRVYRDVRARMAAVNTHLQEHLSGISVVQLARAEARAHRELCRLDAAHRDANISGIFYYAVFFPAVELLTAVGLAGLLVFGWGWAAGGTLSLGVLVAFLQYVQRFYRPISDLAENYNVLQTSLAAAERLQALLATQPAVLEPALPAPPPPRRGTFAYEGVWFAYDDGRWVLSDVDFVAAPGERLAVVGHTGAGKSTLVNLLLRFFDVQRGRVTVDGADVRSLRLADVRGRFAVVLQDVDCFAGSVRDNVSLGREGVRDERILWALEQVQAHGLLRRLPEGLDTVLGERGAGLSVGERQLVSFARALVGDPEFLILDEATASVDPQTEALIQVALDRLLRGRTALIIAHRLATVMSCDRVLVMHGGRLVEQGRHEELLAAGGIYRSLYELQLFARPSPASPVASGIST